MTIVGAVESLWRYPVKSMAGEPVEEAFVGYAGVFGDRHCAFLNAAGPAGFPYLTARTKAEMLLYRPSFRDAELAARPLNQAAAEKLGPGVTPLYPAPLERLSLDVQTPSGAVLAIDDPALREMLTPANAEPGQLSLVRSDRALTDCRPVSLISLATVAQLSDEIGMVLDPRRFRANIYADLATETGFAENAFVGKQLRIGERATVAVLDRDPRCKVISLDPDTGKETANVLRHVAKAHDTRAGIYCAVLTEGTVKRGDVIVMLD
ncbi:MOSC domain-containing protein [Bradyrhizobium sp. LHD-71]|uniref:MOSC domain-containing protein n=1 Tax=Bradyrhizobium sp. LHD-71 TaxID=3072141 RepID=UPI00280DC5D0|nr:MOSC domain-containing protein [Bradyrhizobium sp. LHD-71]MDQ8728412.1 MOSC domain-containing protein [Bradyrhizobium sp. LHD-71]